MNPKITVFILLVLSIVLILRLAIHFQNIKMVPEGSEITYEGKILNQPKISPRGQSASLTLPNSQRVFIIFPLNPTLNYGDRVRVKGLVRYFQTDKGDFLAFMNYPQFEVIEIGTENNLILKVRDNIINFVNSSLPPASASLVLGMTFGIKQEMPESFYQNLQKTGLMHVVAASGMNVTMVGGFFSGFFSLFLRRQTALLISVFGILFYAVMAGLEPSIVRAGVMGIIVLSAQIMGRQSISFLALFFAGFVMLMRSPSILFDIGFQLSFLATAGLIFVRPLFFLSRKLTGIIERSVIGEDVITTLSAQIATLPILLINFGSYSLWSVPANAILLWTVPPIMIIGGLASVFGLIFDPIGRLLIYLVLPFLLYFESIVNFLGERITAINLSIFPLHLAIGYYLLVLGLILFLRRKSK